MPSKPCEASNAHEDDDCAHPATPWLGARPIANVRINNEIANNRIVARLAPLGNPGPLALEVRRQKTDGTRRKVRQTKQGALQQDANGQPGAFL